MKDHSFSHHDCLPYYLRTGDKWTPIDYSKHPDHWMKPLEKGSETGLVEIPANWYIFLFFTPRLHIYMEENISNPSKGTLTIFHQ